MFTSYGQKLRSQNKITDLLVILAWVGALNRSIVNFGDISLPQVQIFFLPFEAVDRVSNSQLKMDKDNANTK